MAETCASFATRWPVDYAMRHGEQRWIPTTDYSNRIALRRFTTKFGDLPLERLPQDRSVTPWAHSLPPSVPKVLRAMLADAQRDGLISENPIPRTASSRGRTQIEAITEDELDLLGDVAFEVSGRMARAYVIWQGTVGTRPVACRHLKREHVDLDLGEVYLEWPGKGCAPRTVIVPPKALEPLSEGIDRRMVKCHRPVRSDPLAEWLFTTPTGCRLSKSNEYRLWDPIRRRFETMLPPERARQLRDARPNRGEMALYELRHCAATSLRRRGADWEAIAWQLGQTDKGEQARKTYSHLTETDHLTTLRSLYA